MKQENTIRAADNQTINGIALTIRTIDGKEKTLTLDQLMQMAGFEKTDKLNQVQFSTEKDGYKLVADANLDPNYPGFNIDGYNGDKLFWFDVEDGKRQWGIEQSNSGKPYVFAKKPWAPSYSVLDHFHERHVYRMEESGTHIFAVRNDDSSPAEQIQLTGCEAVMVRHAIETGEGLITH